MQKVSLNDLNSFWYKIYNMTTQNCIYAQAVNSKFTIWHVKKKENKLSLICHLEIQTPLLCNVHLSSETNTPAAD